MLTEQVEAPVIQLEGISVSSDAAEEAAVSRWTQKIVSARDTTFKDDFDRMRKNMEFAFGIQWPGQKNLSDDRYIANMVNRAINQKVANLYARDPKAIYRRRKRLLYQVWDEKLESLAAALQRATLAEAGKLPPDMEAAAILQDYEHGKALKEKIDRVGQTLELAYQYQVDSQRPDFKVQMKQLVRRVITCSVGYVIPLFERLNETVLASSENQSPLLERVNRIQQVAKNLKLQSGDTQSAEVEQLRLLSESIAASMLQPGPESEGMTERIVFDFVPSTSIIVDPACRALKGFVGARWIAHEMVLPVGVVNAFFKCDVKPGEAAKSYDAGKEVQTENASLVDTQDATETRVCLWHVFDLDTKSHFYIVHGHKGYVQKPKPPTPSIQGFFPVFALTFNDVEVVEGQKATIYPPSDVDLMRAPQCEWNRTRDALREHRKARAPKHLTPKGVLSDPDLAAIANGAPNEVIQLESVTMKDDMTKILMPFPHEPIDPAVYETRTLSDDMMYAQGSQEANLGPARPNVTATVGSIAENSRMTMSSSNVDDLDDFLSAIARACGEMLLQEMSPATVKQIAGDGAAWPDADRREFLNSIYLETMAASSGRPNKALELQNARELGPLLIQAGANPAFLVREFIKRLDDRLEPEDAFPLNAGSPTPMMKPRQQSDGPQPPAPQ